jgi:hypothetical protein
MPAQRKRSSTHTALEQHRLAVRITGRRTRKRSWKLLSPSRVVVDVITEHIRTIWTGTPVELEQAAKDAGLLN